jgi:hypothetical protein
MRFAFRDALDLPRRSAGRRERSVTRTVSRPRSPPDSRALDPASEAALVLLADQPWIAARHVRALVTGVRDGRARDPADPVPGTGRARRSSPRSVWDEAMELTGDDRPRDALLESEPERARWLTSSEDAHPTSTAAPTSKRA